MERIRRFRDENVVKADNVVVEKNVRWAGLMHDYHKKSSMRTPMPVYIQTINIGNWKSVGLSREAPKEYYIGVKKIWPGKVVSMEGYSNDVSSYLPTQRHIRAGIYEGKDLLFWFGQPNIFSEDVFETVINCIKTNDR